MYSMLDFSVFLFCSLNIIPVNWTGTLLLWIYNLFILTISCVLVYGYFMIVIIIMIVIGMEYCFIVR